MRIGIDNLKSGISSAVGIIVEGILLAKKASAIVAEARDIDLAEGSALLIQVVTEEAPKIVAAIKA